MSKEQMAACFNEWMRRYTENPDAFDREWQTVCRFLEETKGGVPSYGEKCAEYFLKLHAQMFPG